ncbi:MAG: histidine phosphatase family protein [Verrucomicrobia bacterium]|nr:histidine phosphatase family protein [Verrucomicrobiota bacterium]MCH8525876.1 histidine phosphatase family protein [Kiritimatiellia bacterium]
MKTLILLRHAKASWSDGAESDIERGLKPKGWRQAEKMSAHLAAEGIRPEKVFCSPSRRTRDTLGLFLKSWDMTAESVVFDDELYLANEKVLMEKIQALPDDLNRVLFLGHNPGFTDLANRLTPSEVYIKNVRPCGVVILEFEAESWRDIQPGEGRLALHLRPKELED